MDLRAQAEQWLAEDPDPETRAELAGLIERSDDAGIADRFSERLEFGTAGIRGPLGAGPNRMNRAVVRRVTAGLAARLRQVDPDAAARGIVVGRDARHRSEEFARDTAAVLTGAGIGVRQFAGPVPTPLVAFAVRALGAGGGVQITASHNPASDNGYKVYGPDGAQIAPPVDAEIAAAAERIESLDDVPVATGSPLLRSVPPTVRKAYLDAARDLALHPEHRDLSIVYTPLHGVAGELCVELLGRAGFANVRTVPAQADPDPDFPTVAFPNPEMPGALDLALDLADEVGADLVIANDPDGDRIAVAVPGARILTGDEVGCLLAEYLLTEGTGGPERVVATTVVSSQLLARIAEAHGVGYAETLTGFKWLAGVAERARAEGGRLVLAYEQALGVMVGDVVRDKDGISAAFVLAELAAWLKARDRTLLDALDDLARRFGVHATAGWSVQLEGARGAALVGETLDRLRTAPPAVVGGVAVVAIADHARGVRRRPGSGAVEPLTTPPADLVGLELADGSRLQIRPSGTEPLLKLYAEVVEPVTGGDVAAARARVSGRLDVLAAAFQQTAFA